MDLEDVRPFLTVRAWHVLVAHQGGQTTGPFVLGPDALVQRLPGSGRAVVRQIHAGLAAYERHTASHPLDTEP